MTTITKALPEADTAIRALLQKASLPTEDITGNVQFYTLTETAETIGTVGVEHDETTALLRSLSVSEGARGKGHGKKLVAFLEAELQRKGVKTIYLLTTTAAPFFARQGYVVVERSDAPPFIQQTSEFQSVCPASATFMKKELP